MYIPTQIFWLYFLIFVCKKLDFIVPMSAKSWILRADVCKKLDFTPYYYAKTLYLIKRLMTL